MFLEMLTIGAPLIWYAPAVMRYMRMQRRILSITNQEIEKDLFELVAHRLS